MSLLSVPINAELETTVNQLVKDGVAANKADLVRKALKRLAEEAAVEEILRAQKEPTLRGDIRKLIKKI